MGAPAIPAPSQRLFPVRPVLLGAAMCLLAVLGLRPAVAGQVVPLTRPAGGQWDVWTVDELGGPVGVAVTGIAFQPVTLSGYAVGERLRADLPTPDGEGGVAPRIRLPQGGSLHRVRHGGAASILHVRGDGTTTLPLTIPASNPADDLLQGLTVSRDGQYALTASSLSAGGDVFLLDLSQAPSVTTLTAMLPPLTVDTASLRVSTACAWFVGGGQLYRFDLRTGLPATVAFTPPGGETLLPEIAASADAESVAVVTEDGAGLRTLHMVDATGSRALDQGDIDTPRYDLPIGPCLALSPEGDLVAYRRAVTTTELFVRRTDTTAPAEQITADASFTDTIDDVGVIGFAGAALLFLAGEFAPGGTQIDSADLFRATFTGGTTTLENLSLTSGQSSPPFLQAGDLDVKAAYDDPTAGRRLLIIDPSGSDAALAAVDLATASLEVLVGDLAADPTLIRVADHVAVLYVSEADLVPAPTRLALLRPVGATLPWHALGAAPAGLVLDRFASDENGTAALVASGAPNSELLILLDLATGAAAAAWPQPFAVTPRVAFTPTGRLAAGLGFAGGPYLFAGFLGPGAATLYPMAPADGFPLSP